MYISSCEYLNVVHEYIVMYLQRYRPTYRPKRAPWLILDTVASMHCQCENDRRSQLFRCSQFLLASRTRCMGNCRLRWESRRGAFEDGDFITALRFIRHQRPQQRLTDPPVSHYRIAFQKSLPPADNLPAKIRLARRSPRRDRFLRVNCRPRETFWEPAIF